MAEPVVCVNWNNHANDLTTICKTFLNSNFCMDCTLAAEGKSLIAHRLILSACSPYFRMLFSQIREDHPIVILGDTLFCTLKTVIDFVYYGKVDIPASQFEAFLELAVSLQIKGLNNYSRKERKTDIDDIAVRNTCQCAATVNSTLMSNEDSFSNSSQQCQFHLPHDCTASMQMESCVSFERHDCDSCEISHSGTILIPLQDHQRPVHNDPELSISPEACVKSELLYSENETVDTKIEVLGQQIYPGHNDPDGFMNTEISVKREQLHLENGTFDIQNNVLDSSMQDGNFESVVSDRHAPSIVQNLDHHSNNRESLNVKDNSASMFLLEQQQKQLKQHEQEQLPCQQHQQMHQQITHLPCEEYSPRLGVQCDTLLPELFVSVSGEVEDAESKESVDDNDVPGNDADEMDEPTLEKEFSPCSSAECILPDEVQATQQTNGRRRRPRECNSFPSPLEQQVSAAEEACSQPGSRVHLNPSPTRGLPNLCNVCGKAFKTSKNLDCHKRAHIERSYSCNICAKTFSHSSSLTAHKRLHSGERPYVCDVCGNAFSHPTNLNVHMRTHTGERPFSCDVCGKAFSQSNILNRHMRTHSGERPYSCDVCGKTFSQLGNRIKHLRTHTGDRPYSCDVCGKAFSESNHLNRHMCTHSGERPYSCDVCGKSFSQSNILNRHMRTHSGERPYSCDVCGKTFTVSGNLVVHKRRHERDQRFGCDACSRRFTTKDELIRHWRSTHFLT